MAGLVNSTPVDTQLEVNLKLTQDNGDLLPNPTFYGQLVGSLIYLTNTRPNIAYAINLVSQFMTTPRHLHLAIVRRIIRYLLDTPHRGLFFPAGSPLTLTPILMLIGLVAQTHVVRQWVGACFKLCPNFLKM